MERCHPKEVQSLTHIHVHVSDHPRSYPVCHRGLTVGKTGDGRRQSSNASPVKPDNRRCCLPPPVNFIFFFKNIGDAPGQSAVLKKTLRLTCDTSVIAGIQPPATGGKPRAGGSGPAINRALRSVFDLEINKVWPAVGPTKNTHVV